MKNVKIKDGYIINEQTIVEFRIALQEILNGDWDTYKEILFRDNREKIYVLSLLDDTNFLISLIETVWYENMDNFFADTYSDKKKIDGFNLAFLVEREHFLPDDENQLSLFEGDNYTNKGLFRRNGVIRLNGIKT